MAHKYYCGIDLGTTNSTISVIDIERGRDQPIDKLSTIPIYQYNQAFNGIDKNQFLLPSYLYFQVEDKKVYTGYYAKDIFAKGNRPLQTVTAVKTRIGGESIVHIPAYKNPGISENFNMTQSSSLLLRTIHQSFREQYGQEIERVVITVPAAFNTDEREATMDAAHIAGFENVKILDEPTATLLYYINGGEGTLSNLGTETAIGEDKYVMVYDLGGGTLDVCIAKVQYNDDGDAEIDMVARSPRADFGGNNFDQLLGAYFLYNWEQARESIENRSMDEQSTIISRLVSKAEEYKIGMNEKVLECLDTPRRMERRARTEAVFEVIAGMKVDMTLTKRAMDEVFLSLTNPDGKLLDPVKHCVQEANLTPGDISLVLLTGGMSEYYAVHEVLQNYFGDIFIKHGDKFEKLIPRHMASGSGQFDYVIPEDRMLKMPVFLYHGLNEKAPYSFAPISGKYFYFDERSHLQKGSHVTIQWTVDQNKTIHLSLPELQQDLKVDQTRLRSFQEAQKDPVNQYQINPA